MARSTPTRGCSPPHPTPPPIPSPATQTHFASPQVLLVIHYLQTATSPPVLPRLDPQTLLIVSVTRMPNKQRIAELLLGFFEHYAALRTDNALSVASASYLPRPAGHMSGLCILDPLAPDEDLGRHLTPQTLLELRRELERARELLISGTTLEDMIHPLRGDVALTQQKHRSGAPLAAAAAAEKRTAASVAAARRAMALDLDAAAARPSVSRRLPALGIQRFTPPHTGDTRSVQRVYAEAEAKVEAKVTEAAAKVTEAAWRRAIAAQEAEDGEALEAAIVTSLAESPPQNGAHVHLPDEARTRMSRTDELHLALTPQDAVPPAAPLVQQQQGAVAAYIAKHCLDKRCAEELKALAPAAQRQVMQKNVSAARSVTDGQRLVWHNIQKARAGTLTDDLHQLVDPPSDAATAEAPTAVAMGGDGSGAAAAASLGSAARGGDPPVFRGLALLFEAAAAAEDAAALKPRGRGRGGRGGRGGHGLPLQAAEVKEVKEVPAVMSEGASVSAKGQASA